MQTHRNDEDHAPASMTKAQLESLMSKVGTVEASIASEGEALDQWKKVGVEVTHLPADADGFLRLSIGGAKMPDGEVVRYCDFRGERELCLSLLRRALNALEAGP